jgi:hypothetical protein
MRVIRQLAVVLIVLVFPLARGVAQTCQGIAAFQDGRARVGVDYQDNSDFNDFRASAAYGIPHSWYAGISADELQVGHGGASATGFGASVGYQIHLSDTPFQFCPAVLGHYASGGGSNTSEFGGGGSAGYRVGISDWFELVPAVGVRWMWENTSNGGGNRSSDDVFLVMGLVFNKTFTINPGFDVPSQNGAKTIYTIGVSINWAK